MGRVFFFAFRDRSSRCPSQELFFFFTFHVFVFRHHPNWFMCALRGLPFFIIVFLLCLGGCLVGLLKRILNSNFNILVFAPVCNHNRVTSEEFDVAVLVCLLPSQRAGCCSFFFCANRSIHTIACSPACTLRRYLTFWFCVLSAVGRLPWPVSIGLVGSGGTM